MTTKFMDQVGFDDELHEQTGTSFVGEREDVNRYDNPPGNDNLGPAGRYEDEFRR